MTQGLTLVTPPGAEPVTVKEAMDYARVGDEREKGLFTGWIKAARLAAEKILAGQLVTAVWRLTRYEFPADVFVLPCPPLQAVNAVEYVGEDGIVVTVAAADYVVATDRTPGFIEPAFGLSWPVARCQADGVRVTFTAGYGPPASVPEDAKTAILWLVTFWHEHRDLADKIPEAFGDMLDPYWHGDLALGSDDE